MTLNRREIIRAAGAISAAYAFPGTLLAVPTKRVEAQERFPEGVASGDPDANSVLLWTRREPHPGESTATLTVEVALDPEFGKIVVRKDVTLSPKADWTCRVLVGGLLSSRVYWYRFTDQQGAGSRTGRTCTAPAESEDRAVRFAFVSCQNVNMGPLTAWRRMVYEDQRAAPGAGIEFVLHLGDFVYDTVFLPEDRPKGYYDRTLRHIVDFPTGEKIDDYHIPTTVQDYRALYRAYLRDPDLQAARARWPFVPIWDNGEFSDKGWQGLERFGTVTRPAQTRKVAANQAWFEYMPARVRTGDGSLASFAAPQVSDVPIKTFDKNGLGQETNNLRAIGSLTGYRALRWGKHVDLILTDQRSYRSEDYTASPESKGLDSKRFPQMVPFETLQIIDAGHTEGNGVPSATLQCGDGVVANFRRESEPRTLLGVEQKAWLLERLQHSRGTWKLWGNTVATLDMRADPQHLPEGLTTAWPGKGYAGYARTDHSTTYAERGEIYDFVQQHGISGFAILSGDRHSFWAGLAAKSLPPQEFKPVGTAFVVGSISSPGMAEAFKYILPPSHPLRPLYLVDSVAGGEPEPTMNLLLRHGVRTCLAYAEHRDMERAKKLSDPGNAPHVGFVDMAGHGYAVVQASAQFLHVEFVCIPRPVIDSGAADGGPLRYRVTHRVALHESKLERVSLEGDAGLSA